MRDVSHWSCLCHVRSLNNPLVYKIKHSRQMSKLCRYKPSRSKLQCVWAAGTSLSLSLCWSVVIWGHLYCTQSGLPEMLPMPSPYWPRSAQPHTSQCPHRNTFSQGQPTPLKPLHIRLLSPVTMRVIEWGSQTFPYQDPHPTPIRFYLRDPQWSIDMCCYDLSVVN